MATKPSKKGQQLYAASDNVASYKTPSPNTPVFGGLKTKGNNGINWNKGDFIGLYTGVAETVGETTWYKVEYLVYHRNRFLGIGNKYSLKPGGSAWDPKVYISYFKETDLSVTEVLSTAAAKTAEKEKEEAEFLKKIQEIIDGLDDKSKLTAAPKGFFASIFGPTVDSGTDLGGINRNTLIGIAGILILAIIGIVAYKRSKRSKDGLPAVSYRKDGLPAVSYRKDGLPAISTRQPPRSTTPQTLGNRKRN